jgi:hypothetical protein
MTQIDTDKYKRMGKGGERVGKYATDRHRFLKESHEICYR